MRYLAKGDDLIALFLKVGVQLADRRVGAIVVCFRPVARGHHPGEQRGAARRAGGRSDEGAVERQAFGREALERRGVNIAVAAERHVGVAQVIGKEDHDIGLRRSSDESRVGKEWLRTCQIRWWPDT